MRIGCMPCFCRRAGCWVCCCLTPLSVSPVAVVFIIQVLTIHLLHPISVCEGASVLYPVLFRGPVRGDMRKGSRAWSFGLPLEHSDLHSDSPVVRNTGCSRAWRKHTLVDGSFNFVYIGNWAILFVVNTASSNHSSDGETHTHTLERNSLAFFFFLLNVESVSFDL